MAASENNGPTRSLLPCPVNTLARPLSPEACSPKLRHEAQPSLRGEAEHDFFGLVALSWLSCRRCC